MTSSKARRIDRVIKLRNDGKKVGGVRRCWPDVEKVKWTFHPEKRYHHVAQRK